MGGATYQVPVDVRPSRRLALSMKWIIAYADRGEKILELAWQVNLWTLLTIVEMRLNVNVHKMAGANKAFSHTTGNYFNLAGGFHRCQVRIRLLLLS